MNAQHSATARSSGPLTPDQIEAFRISGYVIVPGLLSAAEIDRVRGWTDEVQQWPEAAGRWMKYFEQGPGGERLLNRIEDVLPFHDGFRGLAESRLLAGACNQLFGEPAVLFKDKINFKLAGAGGFEPHQDVQAGWSRYASLHVTALVTIDRSTIENGCLEMAGNFRNRGLIGAEWQPLTAEQLAGIDWVTVEAEPGDAVFFDSFVPHRSGPNQTGEARRVLYYTYNRASEGDSLRQYYADKRESYPPDIERQAGVEYRYRV